MTEALFSRPGKKQDAHFAALEVLLSEQDADERIPAYCRAAGLIDGAEDSWREAFESLIAAKSFAADAVAVESVPATVLEAYAAYFWAGSSAVKERAAGSVQKAGMPFLLLRMRRFGLPVFLKKPQRCMMPRVLARLPVMPAPLLQFAAAFPMRFSAAAKRMRRLSLRFCESFCFIMNARRRTSLYFG